jgi:protein SCO1
VSARPLLAVLLGASLLLGACQKKEDAAFEMMVPRPTPAVLAKHWTLPDFALTERTGETLRLADLSGKVWVADFFYTTCPGPCPMMSSRLSDVQKALGDEPGARLVSISVDPEKDTPDVLKQYAERFKASERWYFLTGQKDAIYGLARDAFKLPVAEAPTEGGLITHSTRLVLVDKTGTVRGFYEGADENGVKDLIRDIRRLLDEK